MCELRKKFLLSDDRGIALVTSYLMVTLLATLSLAHFTQSLVERRAQERSRNRIVAFHLAESGVDLAISSLRGDATYTGVAFATLGNSGGYSVVVTTPDFIGNPAVRRIVSTGHTPNNNPQSYAYESEVVTTFVNLSSNERFNFAILMNERIKINGNDILIDSYDSALGPYDPGTAGRNGDLRSNQSQGEVVEIQGRATVQGDVMVGPGVRNPEQAVRLGPNVVVTGQISSAPELVPLPPVVAPAGLRSGGRLNLNGSDTFTLQAGTYLFDSIAVRGRATLNLSGPVQLYVREGVDISGNGVTTAGNTPPNFTLKVIGSSDVKLSGGSNLYGAVYAPRAEVEIGGRSGLEFFGAVVAKTHHQRGNSKLHYDEALSRYNSGSGSNTVSLRSWQQD